MNILKSFTKQTKFKSRDQFLEWFFTRDYHAWIIKDDPIFRAFETILKTMDLSTIEKIWMERDIAFIKAEGTLSCAIDAPTHLKFILCYPELIQYLRSSTPEYGVAIIFHELGHMFHQHTNKDVDQLKAQFEADEFAYFHGFGREIIEIINDYRHIENNRKRMRNISNLLLKESRQVV